MQGFDLAHARGPWPLVPVPTFLVDRRAGLRFQLGWALALALLLGLGALAAAGPTKGLLFGGTALRIIWQQSLPTVLLGLGMAIVLARGGLDLSGAAIASLAGGVAAATGSLPLALAAALGCGLVNGALVALARVPGWLVTGATMFAIHLATTPMFRGRPMIAAPDGTFDGFLGWTSLVAVAATLLAVGAYQVLPSREAAVRPRGRLADGAPYVLSAALAGACGLYLMARLGVVDLPRAPWSRWSELVLVAVLGGGYLGSGRASVVGALLAALGLGALRFGLMAARLPSFLVGPIELALLGLALVVSFAAHVVVARRAQ